MKRRPVVIGNWKMNGSMPFMAMMMSNLLDEPYGGIDVYVCPPFVYLDICGRLCLGSDIRLGAQNVSSKRSGPYTGEVSPLMLKGLGCSLVLIGHSERRQIYHESNNSCARKFRAVTEAGMTPVLCVGETLTQRNDGRTLSVVAAQVRAVVERDGIEMFRDAMIGYEPVWAIGTGLSANADQAQEVHASIRALLAEYDEDIAQGVRILYGGSVKPSNARVLFAQPDVDGGLVGGAALNPEHFKEICRAAVS
jgi:triosephosphate isomerase